MNKLVRIVENELHTLDIAIDYADGSTGGINLQHSDPSVAPMLSRIHGRQQTAYKEFLRVAWGKAIRLSTSQNGEVIYRLTQSAAVIPKCNIATPQSPVGRLINIARPGFRNTSDALGDYTVEDVWYFERFVGREYLGQIKNFALMAAEGSNKFAIRNLQEWLGREQVPVTTIEEKQQIDLSGWDDVRFADTEEEIEQIQEEMDNVDGIQMPTKFYVNLNEHQYDAAHSQPSGLVYVFGIAGSGKTSVALSRSKSLSQLGQLPKEDSQFNSAFPEETQIGIVRTGELISYLRDTCDQLSLHGLPIKEYREIHQELKALWNIEKTSQSNKQPAYLLDSDIEEEDSYTRYAWYEFVSRAMLRVISHRFSSAMTRELASVSSIDGDIFSKLRQVIADEVSSALNSNQALGFLTKLNDAIGASLDRLFLSSVWVGLPIGDDAVSWHIDQHENLVHALLNQKRPICRFKSVENTPFLVPKQLAERWWDWLPPGARNGLAKDKGVPTEVTVTATDGRTLATRVEIADDEELKRYILDGSIRFYLGVRKQSMTLSTQKLWIANMRAMATPGSDVEGASKNTRDWRKRIRTRIVANLRTTFSNLAVADLYVDAMAELKGRDCGDFQSLVLQKSNAVEKKRLSENDIDLLIAFMSSVTRGLPPESSAISGKNIKAAPYRSSVFIDEVQDFTEIQILSIFLLSDPTYDSVTAVGDPAQCLFRKPANLAVSVPKNVWQQARTEQLTDNIRQHHVPTLQAMGSAFRKKFIDDLDVDLPEFKKNDGLDVIHVPDKVDQLRRTYKVVSSISKQETLVIVAPTDNLAQIAVSKLKPHFLERLHRDCEYSAKIDLAKKYIAHITTPKNIKGLEFDHLIALNLEEYNLNAEKDRNALYVIMTRPMRSLRLMGDFSGNTATLREFLTQFADIQALTGNLADHVQ